jgi:protein-S-isoprenylcysteine O-methyltransferase Ste14
MTATLAGGSDGPSVQQESATSKRPISGPAGIDSYIGHSEPYLPTKELSIVASATGAQIRLVPPVVYFGAFAVMWALHWWRPWTTPGGDVLAVAGLALVLAGVALTIWSAATFSRAHTTIIPWGQVSALVTSGPFRISRNPIYLADAIAYLGGTLLIQSWWPLVALPGVLVVIRLKVINHEERYLTERFGDAYREYQLSVRRWL